MSSLGVVVLGPLPPDIGSFIDSFIAFNAACDSVKGPIAGLAFSNIGPPS